MDVQNSSRGHRCNRHPLDQNGHVNLEALDILTDFLISKGIHGLFPCGSTGEGVLLDLDERKFVALRTIKRACRKMPVLVHTGALARRCDELTLHARDIGAAGASLIPAVLLRHGPELPV